MFWSIFLCTFCWKIWWMFEGSCCTACQRYVVLCCYSSWGGIFSSMLFGDISIHDTMLDEHIYMNKWWLKTFATHLLKIANVIDMSRIIWKFQRILAELRDRVLVRSWNHPTGWSRLHIVKCIQSSVHRAWGIDPVWPGSAMMVGGNWPRSWCLQDSNHAAHYDLERVTLKMLYISFIVRTNSSSDWEERPLFIALLLLILS